VRGPWIPSRDAAGRSLPASFLQLPAVFSLGYRMWQVYVPGFFQGNVAPAWSSMNKAELAAVAERQVRRTK
jgi:hypothetical protein